LSNRLRAVIREYRRCEVDILVGQKTQFSRFLFS
jgi:hypothetical protein